MTYPPYIKAKARRLRLDGRLTIDEIAERLAISRTTAFYWVGDIPIPRSGGPNRWPESARRKGNRAMRAKFLRLRREAYLEGKEQFASLAVDPTFRDFVCMYIGEGYRRSRNTVAVANANPSVIQLANRWIRAFSRNPVTYSFQYHADQDPAEVVRFWSEHLGVDPGAFRYQRKSNSGQLNGRTWRSKYGVLTVCANDTLFRARLQAWMDGVQRYWL